MTKTTKAIKPVKEPKLNKENISNAKAKLGTLVDWIAKILASAFFIGASYGYVENWLKTHQNHYDLSVAGGILIISIALYLYTRKR